MAMQAFANYRGGLFSPADPFGVLTGSSVTTMDAAGESCALIGYVNLSTGPGTSKVISSAGGGFIHWPAGTATFANGTTNVRVGINDVSAGLEDGTHDVYGDLTGGGGGITASTMNRTAMTSGTKTIAHGDLIAVVVEMTARGGADAVQVTRSPITNGALVPYGTHDIGSGVVRGLTSVMRCAIEFDDGTLGWFDGCLGCLLAAQSAFSSGSVPDEYALVFTLPFRASVSGLWAVMNATAQPDDYEFNLYSDPLGTPVAERTFTQDADIGDVTTGGQIFSRPFTSAYILEPNTVYAIAMRPTTANTLGFYTMSFGTNGANIRKATALGANWSMYSRTDQTGAFGSQDTTKLPMFGFWYDSLSDDEGEGGGGGPLIGGRLVR
jgi:hypothetical protein